MSGEGYRPVRAGGVAVTTTLDDAVVRAAFARLAALAVDLGPVLREVGDNLVELRRARFLRSQGPNRVPWLAKRPRRDGKNLPLVLSGRLRDSIAAQVAGNSVLIGSDLPYAAVHEFGGGGTRRAYSRKVAFRRVTERVLGADGETTTRQRFQFARSRGKGAHKRIETRNVTYGERILQIPARPFLAADDDDRDEIDDVVSRHITRTLLARQVAP